jgi:hypothetical protein
LTKQAGRAARPSLKPCLMCRPRRGLKWRGHCQIPSQPATVSSMAPMTYHSGQRRVQQLSNKRRWTAVYAWRGHLARRALEVDIGARFDNARTVGMRALASLGLDSDFRSAAAPYLIDFCYSRTAKIFSGGFAPYPRAPSGTQGNCRGRIDAGDGCVGPQPSLPTTSAPHGYHSFWVEKGCAARSHSSGLLSRSPEHRTRNAATSGPICPYPSRRILNYLHKSLWQCRLILPDATSCYRIG